jgi:menaquinol-cytochrome c reductase iron-sulfur subunit
MSDRKRISRRTFLMYSLMGTGGFLAATILTPLVRFAIDPALKAKDDSDWVPVGDIGEFGPEPKKKDFKVKQVDGWYESEVVLSAWIMVENGKVLALSPVCKHLGCTVNWNGSPDRPNHYFCPCHFGFYEKSGKNVPGTPPPAPLDEYETKVEGGKLYLGKIIPNRLVRG